MDIKKMTLEEKIGQMLMFAFHGTSYNEQLEFQLKNLHVGGIIHFARNIDPNSENVIKLNNEIKKNSKYPVFIGTDQEGGMVVRVTNDITPFPGAMTLSATQEDITNICFYEGVGLKELGFNIVFAPVADVNNNPYNPVISSRSYSDDPNVVAKHINEAVTGFKKANILSTLKHFPGHGDTSVDSHLSMPSVNKSLEELEKVELYPFEKAVANGCDGIMAAHILYNQLDNELPSTLSEKIIKKILREKMGFKGLVITDSLTMGAINANFTHREIVKNCVNAGVDIMMFCGKADLEDQKHIYETFLDLVKCGEIKIETVDEAVERIIKLKEKYVLTDAPIIDKEKAYNEAINLFEKGVTLVENKMDVVINKNEKVLVIFPEVKLSTLVDNETSEYRTIKTYLEEVDEIIINQNLENFDLLVQKSKNYDKIIMATLNVKTDDYQVKVFNALDKEKVVVVSLRSPYDNMHLKGLENYICLYEVTKWSLMSLAKCLQGKVKFQGKLPIKLVR